MAEAAECSNLPALSILNPHPQLLPGQQLVHDLVRGEPQACAIDFLSRDGQTEQTTYADLDERSSIWAAKLRFQLKARSAARNSVVPLLIPQSTALYVAMLAVLRAGCAFAPLDINAPTDRLNFIVDDVSARVVLTTTALKHQLSVSDQLLILTVEELDELPTSVELGDVDVQPQDLAYIMYTSGSTGLPKGVELSHLAVAQSLHAHQRHIPPFRRFLQTAASVFDVSQFEIWFPLSRGCTIVSCDRQILLNDIPAVIDRMDIDAAEFTPTVAGGLVQSRSRVPKLKLLLTIGEMLTPSIVEEFGGDAERESILWGMYGQY